MSANKGRDRSPPCDKGGGGSTRPLVSRRYRPIHLFRIVSLRGLRLADRRVRRFDDDQTDEMLEEDVDAPGRVSAFGDGLEGRANSLGEDGVQQQVIAQVEDHEAAQLGGLAEGRQCRRK